MANRQFISHIRQSVVCFLFLATPVSAIVIRDDQNDNLYQNLGSTQGSAVWLQIPQNGGVSCTGTLIAPDWVMTACHCVQDLPTANLGAVTVGNGNALGGNTLATGVAEVVLNPFWDSTVTVPGFTGRGSFDKGNDIALIHLSAPVTVPPMNRSSGSVASLENSSVTLFGYGSTGNGITGVTTNTSVLRGATNVIDQLGSALGASYSDNLILMDFDGPLMNSNLWGSAIPTFLEGIQAPGDSGGPWIVGGTVAGVTSFGDAQRIYGTDGAATAVSPWNDWINSTMGGVNWNSRAANVPFNTASAWGDGRVPNGGDVRFSLPLLVSAPVPSITFGNDVSLDHVTVEFGPQEFNVGSQALFAHSIVVDHSGKMILSGGRIYAGGLTEGAGGALTVGQVATGQFEQRAGDAELDDITIGGVAGSNGGYQLDSGSLTVHSPVYVGFGGQGQFNQSGGSLNASGIVIGLQGHAVGQYVIQGGAATSTNPVSIGSFGTGTLLIAAGGKVSDTYSYIGENLFSSGTATIDGAGSTWTNSSLLFVGNSGTGTLTIADGGSVTNSIGYLGFSGTGSAIVRNSGSTWSNSDLLEIGVGGTGALTITAAGRVSNTNGVLGLQPLSSGSAIVTGVGSLWNNNGTLTIGDSGTGTLMVAGGASVTNTIGSVGFATGSTGTATVSGMNSNWINSDRLEIGGSGKGILTIQAGGHVSDTSGSIGFASTGTATVTGPGSIWTNSTSLVVGAGSLGTGSLTIGASGSVSSADGYISGSAGTVTVTDAGSVWTNSGQLTVDGFSTATLNILNGGAVSNAVGVVGYNFSGAINVIGPGSIWTNTSSLHIGDGGSGNLTLADGGKVSTAALSLGYQARSSGNVTIGGAGSNFSAADLDVGTSGTGALIIQSGGGVSSDQGWLGRNANSSGTVIVTDGQSSWTNTGQLTIGEAGTGALTIQAGGTVSNDDAILGDQVNSTGTVIVTGSQSRWMNNHLFVGNFGAGILRVEAGGTVLSTLGSIGMFASQTSTASVSGPGSTWIDSGSLFVGNFGTGRLTVQDGGAVFSTFGYVGAFAGSNGAATVGGSGSRWTMTEALSIGGDTSIGTVNVDAGGSLIVGGNIVLFPNGSIKLDGGELATTGFDFRGGQFQWTSGKLHADSYSGNLVNSGGTLAPGRSTGSTDILGNYTQRPAAVLEIEIGGGSPGSSYDLVDISNMAIIGGKLQLALLNGFTPSASDMFTVLNAAGGIFGVFNNVTSGLRLTTNDGIGSFLVYYGPGSAFNQNQIVLTGFELIALAGDYNHNGVVDAADYTVWRDSLGRVGAGLVADGNGDGIVDQADYDIWKNHFGRSSGSAAAQDVPEPAAAALLFAACVAISCGRIVPRRSTRITHVQSVVMTHVRQQVPR